MADEPEMLRQGGKMQKLSPKLRMVSNGSMEVNTVRAELMAAVAVDSAAQVAQAPVRGIDEVQLVKRGELGKTRGAKRSLTPAREATEACANVFVQLRDDLTERPGAGRRTERLVGESASKANLVTATMPISELAALRDSDDVVYVELGEPLAAPRPAVADTRPRPPAKGLRKVGDGRKHRFGAGVLVGIIDVGGYDFTHPDFLDEAGQTRFVRIWDQGGSIRQSPAAGGLTAFDYGAELRGEHLNAAIAEHEGGGLPATLLEPQTQMAEGSHATHVASIAAGNRGICRAAAIAGVLIDLGPEDTDRRRSFYDSTRLAHAVDYLLALGTELGMPVSINISLATNGHAHDASSAVSRWIDASLTVPGRCVAVAAGNAGQEAPAYDGDIGFVMGRIHTSGRIAARGLAREIEWNVVGNGVADVSENELEIWYGAQDRFAVEIKPPNGPWIGPVAPRQFIENRQLADGSFLSVYNDLYHPANGSNLVAVYLSPLLSADGVVGVPAGTWTVRLRAIEVREGDFHAWVERDDPRPLGPIGAREAWQFPSFFSARSFVDSSTVSSLACGRRVVAAANLDAEGNRIHVTSSQGPTRLGEPKPEVAAPGTGVVAAKGFAEAGDDWVAMTGTSMASPYVAGVAGLMLAVDPTLTAAQIIGIMRSTALPLPGADYTWRNDAGFGVLDADACLAEAADFGTRVDLTDA